MYYIPNNYKLTSTTVAEFNMNEGFAGAKFPICSWNTDSYTNWLTQNSINEKYNTMGRISQVAAGVGMMALGAATTNPLVFLGGTSTLGSGIGGAIGDVVEQMKEKEQHELSPKELSGNASLGDVMWAYNRSEPQFFQMNIKEEYAKIIDKFFDQFGYQVNILKKPNIHTRSNWNYIKTKNCNFTGDIPQEYMTRIKKIFDSGITFWHKPSKMLDYSQTNSVIS